MLVTEFLEMIRSEILVCIYLLRSQTGLIKKGYASYVCINLMLQETEVEFDCA